MAKEKLLGSGALVVLIDAGFNSFDLILSVVDVLFPMVALVSNQLAPEIGWLNQELMQNLLIVVALLYLVHLSEKLYRRLRNNDSQSR